MSVADGRAPTGDLAYYEAVPYLLVLESVERGGQWLRRAEHPELPGCAAEAHSALEASTRSRRSGSRAAAALGPRRADPRAARAAAGEAGGHTPSPSLSLRPLPS